MRAAFLRLLTWGFILGTTLAAQTTGSLEGMVTDPSVAPVENAEVTLTLLATRYTRTVRSDGHGRFVAPGLPPGAYRLEVLASGFRPALLPSTLVSAGRTIRVDVPLQLGDLREAVVVTETAPLVSSSASDWGGTVDNRQMVNLPLNGRDLFDLASQQPAVTIANNNEGAIFNGLGIQPSVNGNRPNQNSFRLDGLYLNDASGSAPASAGGRLLGVEGIQEIRLITNPFNAEYGRAASGVFTAISRSGSNDWHGSLYHFFRNSALDAKNYFDSPTEKIPALRRNQFGGMLSGPLRRDRVFFLANYESLREVRSRTQRATTPTAEARRGILPTGTVAVHPAVQPYLGIYPLPNGQSFGDGTGEFISAATRRGNDDFFATRGDILWTERLRSSVRYSWTAGDTSAPDSLMLWQLRTDSRFDFIQTETTFAQSPVTLHIFRLGYSRVRNTEDATPPALDASLSFVPGRPVGNIEVTGLTDLAPAAVSALPRNHLLRDGQWNYDLLHTRGGHNFRFGAGYDFVRFNQIGDFQANGRYRFSSLQGFLRAETRGADLMTPDSDTARLWRQHQFFLYAQDELRPLRHLSLILGVRYEGYTSPSEANGKIATLRNPLRDTGFTIGGPLFDNPSATNFAPRAGLAWDLTGDGRTVFRAGAGMFFDLLTSREVTIAGMRVPPFFTRAFLPANTPFPRMAEALATARIDSAMDGLAYYVQQPYVLQYRASMERQLGQSTAVEIGYSGSRGVHLLGQFGDLNVAQPEVRPDGSLFFPATGPLRNPALGRIGIRTTDFNSFYHALTVRLQRRFARGLQFQSSYTWAKALDESSSSTQTDFDNSDRMPHPYSIRDQRGPADFDVRQSLNVNATWQIPSPDGGWARRLAGNWELLTVAQVQTGFPFNPRVGFDQARMRSGFGDLDQRPNLAIANKPAIFGDPNRYFDTNAFALPAPGTLGNLGRNTLTGPGLISLNLGVHKALWKTERQELRFRAEAFNATNHPNFDGPSELRLFTSTGGRVGAAGRITTTATPSRQIQFALRWVF
jgi:hypothetical protein